MQFASVYNTRTIILSYALSVDNSPTIAKLLATLKSFELIISVCKEQDGMV